MHLIEQETESGTFLIAQLVSDPVLLFHTEHQREVELSWSCRQVLVHCLKVIIIIIKVDGFRGRCEVFHNYVIL